MEKQYTNEPMLEMFLFETSQLVEQLEEVILAGEKQGFFTPESINEIFRIMHTIKGSAAMMMFQNISTLAHSMEDIFYFLREQKPDNIDYSRLSDLVLEGADFMKLELEKIRNNDKADGDPDKILKSLKDFLSLLKQEKAPAVNSEKTISTEDLKQQYYIRPSKAAPSNYHNAYKAVIFFEEGCEMENIRAYTILHNLKEVTEEVYFIPDNIIESDDSIEVIRREGFQIYLKCDLTYEKMQEFFNQTIFLRELQLDELQNNSEFTRFFDGNKDIEEPVEIELNNQKEAPPQKNSGKPVKEAAAKETQTSGGQQSIISVSVPKLDKLLDLVGEMVIAEAMVIQNPDLANLELGNFEKAARQLNKITSEIQDMVMAIRMVPLSATFHKMHRIVRDMSRKLNKEVQLTILGEETEVDKNIIEHISDPLMHLVRNSIDHGLETKEERLKAGKPEIGTVTLEAKNAGSDVLIIVRDDGKGLNKEKILSKAGEHGLLYKNPDEMTEKEIFNLILLPGFSTKDSVTEFSGRGVGMDVVAKNIESVGGSLMVESIPGKGTAITLRIPLTLAIIDGMNIRVGNSCYTIPIISIRESFRPKEKDIITDPDGNEMIMVRGECYKIVRLHEIFNVKDGLTDLTKGIIIMTELDEKSFCIFADELIGQQQVVVKALPKYIQSYKKIRGLAGCTLLGDGSISLILDVAGLFSM